MKKVLFSLAALLVLAAGARAGCPPLAGASFAGNCGTAASYQAPVATFQAVTPYVATQNVFAAPACGTCGSFGAGSGYGGFGLGAGYGGVGFGLGYGGVGVGVRHRGIGLGGVRKVGVRGRGVGVRGRGVGLRGKPAGIRGRGVGMRGKPAAKPARAIRRR